MRAAVRAIGEASAASLTKALREMPGFGDVGVKHGRALAGGSAGDEKSVTIVQPPQVVSQLLRPPAPPTPTSTRRSFTGSMAERIKQAA